MENSEQIQNQYETRREEVKKLPTEQQESPHETMSHIVESNIQQQVPTFQASTHVAQNTDASLPPEEQAKVQSWVNEVFSKSLEAGIKAAADSGDMALIDAFHAALTGQLHDQLVAAKKVENIN